VSGFIIFVVVAHMRPFLCA